MVLILFIFNEKETMYRLFAIIVAMMVVVSHQKNISRLMKGTESKAHIFKSRDKRNLK
jgi:glycerol-3-phosphate acyltransferase PlsY